MSETIKIVATTTAELVSINVDAEREVVQVKVIDPVREVVQVKVSETATLPTASDTVKGGVKIGAGLTMTGEALSVDGSLYDAAGSAAAAQTAAQSYADGLAVNYDPAGAAATAQSNAESYADGLAVNYATAAQGALADTAVQPSGLSGYEQTANKSTSVTTDQGSNTKYPSVKSVYDWATGLFLAASSFTAANIKSLLGITTLSGSNTGDQTSIVGITGTLSEFNAALTGADFATGGGTATGTNTGDQTITLTGDATGSGTGSFAATLATVNANTGSFGSATKTVTVTVNGKGLITAISEQTATPAIGSVTGLGTGVSTFLATPSSSNLATAVTDETGSGALVFGTSPTIDSPIISGTPAFIGTTRPTSSGTGVPAATSLITRDDALLLPYYTRRLFNSCVGTASGTGATARRGQGSGIVDGDLTTTPASGAYFKITILSAGGGLVGNASSSANLSARWMMLVRFACYLGTNTHIMLCFGADCASGVPSSGVNIGMEITSNTSVRLWRCNSGAAVYSSAGTISNAAASTMTHDQFFWLECDGAGNLNLYYANKAYASAMPARPSSALCTLSGLASGFTDSTLPAMWLRAQSTSLSVAPNLLLRDCTFTEF